MATTSVQGIGVRYGILSAVAMIIYFLIINALGFQNSEIIRFGSNIFILIAVVLAIGTLKKSHDALHRETPYLPGLAIGFLVGLLGSGLYAGFILFHAIFLEPGYAGVLHNQDYFGIRLPLMMVLGSVVILGTAVGAMTGYILMMAFDHSGGHQGNANY
ncbi:hypothetical protein ACD591_12605 [Rufibacter glacialis]|uniref:DUF4199 domain-containing protein n=1 Tax=Rufibacter glacialis TaxID=1259555 RepID=A0A5M8QRQ9_9BACT|nr:hypothetical protein [Rufibacter glacialis]KAA6437193.1 hypothetical protein FOE74_01465 [Rufibacter glacialis]